MSREAIALSRPESGVETVGKPGGDIQQRPLTGGFVMGDGSLKQMPGTEVLVEESQVFEAQIRLFDLHVGVEIAVRLLSGGDFCDERVHLPFQFGVRVPAENIGCPFNPFVDV